MSVRNRTAEPSACLCTNRAGGFAQRRAATDGDVTCPKNCLVEHRPERDGDNRITISIITNHLRYLDPSGPPINFDHRSIPRYDSGRRPPSKEDRIRSIRQPKKRRTPHRYSTMKIGLAVLTIAIAAGSNARANAARDDATTALVEQELLNIVEDSIEEEEILIAEEIELLQEEIGAGEGALAGPTEVDEGGDVVIKFNDDDGETDAIELHEEIQEPSSEEAPLRDESHHRHKKSAKAGKANKAAKTHDGKSAKAAQGARGDSLSMMHDAHGTGEEAAEGGHDDSHNDGQQLGDAHSHDQHDDLHDDHDAGAEFEPPDAVVVAPPPPCDPIRECAYVNCLHPGTQTVDESRGCTCDQILEYYGELEARGEIEAGTTSALDGCCPRGTTLTDGIVSDIIDCGIPTTADGEGDASPSATAEVAEVIFGDMSARPAARTPTSSKSTSDAQKEKFAQEVKAALGEEVRVRVALDANNGTAASRKGVAVVFGFGLLVSWSSITAMA